MADNYHCGINRFMPKWLRKILSIHFNEACRMHDKNHNEGADYKVSDQIFLYDMREIAGKNPFLHVQAVIYYVVVRIFSKWKTKNKNKS